MRLRPAPLLGQLFLTTHDSGRWGVAAERQAGTTAAKLTERDRNTGRTLEATGSALKRGGALPKAATPRARSDLHQQHFSVLARPQSAHEHAAAPSGHLARILHSHGTWVMLSVS